MGVRQVLLLSLLRSVTAVTQEELSKWFYSTNGLNLGRSDADNLAYTEAPILTQCAVSIEDLTQLRSVLYSTSFLNYNAQELRDKLLPLAKQHVDPDVLKQMYTFIYSTSGLNLPQAVAKSAAVELVKAYAEPEQVKGLWGVLYGTTGVNLPSKDAQVKSLELAKAGCDPVALKNSFQAASGSKDDRLKAAIDSAVRANLNYQDRRYAKDGKGYNADGFQKFYGAGYLKEWSGAPAEKRVAPDHKAYTASQFRMFFQSTWESEWDKATLATQQRIAKDGRKYTVAEFKEYYNDDWQKEWADAPELPCQECASAAIVV